jgi:hypothetical protein
MKAAHAALAGAAYRKSGYLARFSRDVGFHEPESPACESSAEAEEKVKNIESNSVESHISRKTSEIWGTQVRFMVESLTNVVGWGTRVRTLRQSFFLC